MLTNICSGLLHQVIACTFVFLLAPAIAASAGQVSFMSEKQQLTASLSNEPIADALKQIASQTGVTFLLDSALTGTVSVHMQDLPLEEAIRRLLGKNSHAMIFAPSSNGGYRLSTVKVFREGKQATAQFTVIGKGAAASRGKTENGGTASASLENSADTDTTALADIQQENPLGTDHRGRLIQEIAATNQTIALLQHRTETGQGILRGKITEARMAMSQGDGNQMHNLTTLKELEGLLSREQQNASMMLLNEQKNRVALTQELAQATTPADEKLKVTAQATRQAGLAKPSGQGSVTTQPPAGNSRFSSNDYGL